MSNFHYKHFQQWEKIKLERLIGNKPTLEPIFGMTNQGWQIIKYNFLVDIAFLSSKLGRERKTIKNELIRGKYQTLTNDISKPTNTFCYSRDASEQHCKTIAKNRRIQNTKILMNSKLREFVRQNLSTQSLKGIGGRTKIAMQQGLIETTLSHTALYNYIDNIHVDFINNRCLKRTKKHRYRLKYMGKRQNGVSINERPQTINNRKEFGHWEMDLIEGKRTTNVNLLTLCERQTKMGIAVKINGKESKTITKTLRMLQSRDVLIYGVNVKSITPDNGSEFWDWQTFQKSIHNTRDDIDVWFTNPYCSWEKGSVENFNGLIRKHLPKGTDFSDVSNEKLNSIINQINNLYRPSLNYLTAKEFYNSSVQTNLGTLHFT